MVNLLVAEVVTLTLVLRGCQVVTLCGTVAYAMEGNLRAIPWPLGSSTLLSKAGVEQLYFYSVCKVTAKGSHFPQHLCEGGVL